MIPLPIAQALADALQTALLRGNLDTGDRKECRESLAAFESAKEKPMRVTLHKRERVSGSLWTDEYNSAIDDVSTTLKAQGIEVEE